MDLSEDKEKKILGLRFARLFRTLTLDEVFSSEFDDDDDFENNGYETDFDADCIPRMYVPGYHDQPLDRSCCPPPPPIQRKVHNSRDTTRKSSLARSDEFFQPLMNLKSSSKSSVPKTGFTTLASKNHGGECVFCRNNGEVTDVYKSHTLKNRNGIVICPILRAYTCPICQVSGDMAHTIRYCPKNKSREGHMPHAVSRGLLNASSVEGNRALP